MDSQPQVEEGRTDQLLDADLWLYLVIYLKHALYCLFSRDDFTRGLEQNDLEKQLKPWVTALNNLLAALNTSVNACLLARPTVWF